MPSGLTLYWFVNNIISTGMQLYMRNTIKVDIPALAAEGSAASPIIDVSSTVIKPKEDRSKQVWGCGGEVKSVDVGAAPLLIVLWQGQEWCACVFASREIYAECSFC